MQESTTLDQAADQAAGKADQALSATKRATNGAIDRLQDGVESIRQDAHGALSRAAAQVDELTRRGLERARQTSADVKRQVEQTGDRTVSYIRDEPVKSVLIAAATGAVLTALIALLTRSRDSGR